MKKVWFSTTTLFLSNKIGVDFEESMYYLPPTIELPCYIRYADGTERDLGEMCGVRSNSTSPATTPVRSPSNPARQQDSDRDVSEALRTARAMPNFLKGLSTIERIYQYLGPPEKVEQVNESLPDFVKPTAHWWSVKTRREGRVVAYVRVLFTTDDRVGDIRLFWQRL